MSKSKKIGKPKKNRRNVLKELKRMNKERAKSAGTIHRLQIIVCEIKLFVRFMVVVFSCLLIFCLKFFLVIYLLFSF